MAPRSPPDLSRFSDVYADESSQTQHRYMLLGGLVVPTLVAPRLKDALMAARLPELPQGEMAWTKVSRSKLPAYEKFVEKLFERRWPVAFHCLVIDTHKIKDRTFNNGSREIGYNKEIYQLLMKAWRLERSRNFHVYLDKRNVTSPPSPEIAEQMSLSRLRYIVNCGIRKRELSADWPMRRIHFRESKDCMLMQAADILLGAVGYHVNGHRMLPNASGAKSSLSDRILRLAQVSNPMADTAAAGRFTIWHRQLR